ADSLTPPLSSISKAINSTEAPVKEKHARRIILGTHREKGAYTFWSYALGLPLASSSILSWKFCHVLHKVLRDGHQNSLQDCMRHHSSLIEIGQLWGNLHDKYGQLVALYSKMLCTKMEFHVKHPEIRANLEVTDEVLERAAGTDINNVFQLTVEVFDYMDTELRVAETVLRQLNTSIAISTLTAGQCRLSPLIQVIQDCSHLYHFTVKLLFKLHSCLPADTLQGHRDRFHDQFHSLKNFFNKARDMQYFKRLIQIPKLPDSPPNFLHAASLAKHVKPVVVIPDEPQDDEDDDPEPLIEVGDVPTASSAPTQVPFDIFDQTFGAPNGRFDDRDQQIEGLKRDVEMLRAELERVKAEAQRYITQLKSQINSLEAELEEQRAQKQRSLVENEQLRMELEATRLSGPPKNLSLPSAERAQATEQRYNKLKDKHTELVADHADLLRKVLAHSLTHYLARWPTDLLAHSLARWPIGSLTLSNVSSNPMSLLLFTQDLTMWESSDHAGMELSGSMTSLQAEKERLMRSVSEKEAELSSLRQSALAEQSSLQVEREKSSRDLGNLQSMLQEKVSQLEQLKQKLLEEQFSLLQGTVSEAENIIQDAVAKLDDPLHVRCTSSPDYLVSRAEATLASIDHVKTDAGALVRALTQFSHLAADTIVNGSATAHTAPVDHADRLTENCRSCAVQSLAYLKELKEQASVRRADPAAVRLIVQKILHLGQELRPKGSDVRQDELGDMVDKEMAATQAAIDEAVRRIDVSSPRLIFIKSATLKEFYARNSRWTEGLISASKAVGWGATQMVESADKVVLHTGKYEELIVCSHEIAASTAQLVAASKVKADRNSTRLTVLQQASRTVNEMAANVVASTRTGLENLEEKDTMDFSGMSLIKLKKEEMESQVKVLELESQLENERLRLGELRKKHYGIAGAALVSDDNGVSSSASSPSHGSSLSPRLQQKPSVMKKPNLAQKPSLPVRHKERKQGKEPCVLSV
uniref:Huntingtin interacting protein 1 related n=1 Tax=Gadus morhua TaxID=8049 RepID=A0A8C4ZW86_GADMO